ncbi:hypothetical protein BU17DRAFT_70187 [Hysterangium stoloniferum]|nr:hypothetical protein BU17DRAFT_70187 [Hysterangium stoloniferum]
MSDSSSSISLSGSDISAENPIQSSPPLSPLSFQLDEDFQLLAEMTWASPPRIVRPFLPTQCLSSNKPPSALESCVRPQQPPSSATKTRPFPDNSNLSSPSSQSTTSLTSAVTSESRSSSPRPSVPSAETVSIKNASTKSCTLPPPLEHLCVESAKQMGIKVRDFAYEDHGVKPAPVVDELDGLKGEYLRYRSAGQMPPRETMDVIKLVDSAWFQEQEQKFTVTS